MDPVISLTAVLRPVARERGRWTHHSCTTRPRWALQRLGSSGRFTFTEPYGPLTISRFRSRRSVNVGHSAWREAKARGKSGPAGQRPLHDARESRRRWSLHWHAVDLLAEALGDLPSMRRHRWAWSAGRSFPEPLCKLRRAPAVQRVSCSSLAGAAATAAARHLNESLWCCAEAPSPARTLQGSVHRERLVRDSNLESAAPRSGGLLG